MSKRQFLFDGANVKSIAPWDLDSNVGWTVLGGDQSAKGIDLLAQRVPWMYRAIKDRANNVSHMPWGIERNDTEIVTSEEWGEDKPKELEFISNPRQLFSQIEQSMVIAGKAYCALEVNKSGYIQALKYLNPNTIAEVYNNNNSTVKWQGQDYKPGEIMYYNRTINGKQFPCSRADMPPVAGMVQIVCIYDPDYSTEIGPGKWSDGLAAMTAAGVLYNYDEFVSGFFGRGAIKASVLTVESASPGEQERLQKWWDDVIAGVKNAWSAIVLRGKMNAPVVIGTGLEGVENNDLTQTRRQDISTAMGVPESRMWSAAANMATRKEDEAAYFRGTILPECDLIAEALNEQVFNDVHKLNGYRIEFQPETLDVFQEDESERAGSLQTLTSAGVPLLMAMDILGYDLTDEQRAELEVEPPPPPEPVPPALVPFAGQDNQPAQTVPVVDTSPVPAPAMVDEGTNPPMRSIDMEASVRAMLKNWQRKALYQFKTKGSYDLVWSTDLISREKVEEIFDTLKYCETPEQIKAVFANVEIEPVEVETVKAVEDPILILAREFRLLREAVNA